MTIKCILFRAVTLENGGLRVQTCGTRLKTMGRHGYRVKSHLLDGTPEGVYVRHGSTRIFSRRFCLFGLLPNKKFRGHPAGVHGKRNIFARVGDCGADTGVDEKGMSSNGDEDVRLQAVK